MMMMMMMKEIMENIILKDKLNVIVLNYLPPPIKIKIFNLENPPQYDQLSTHEPHEAPSSTLFELGEDDEISDHEGDNRLKDEKHKE